MAGSSWLSMSDFNQSMAVGIAREIATKLGADNRIDGFDIVSFKVVRSRGVFDIAVSVGEDEFSVMISGMMIFSHFELADPECFEKAVEFIEKRLAAR